MKKFCNVLFIGKKIKKLKRKENVYKDVMLVNVLKFFKYVNKEYLMLLIVNVIKFLSLV